MTSEEQLLYQIALTQINGVGDITARNLLLHFSTPEAIFSLSQKELIAIPGIAHKTVDEIKNPEVFERAKKELDFVLRNGIETFFVNDSDYPHRLRECSDAPILLYYKGNTDLNKTKIVSIVGTRNASPYGNQFCDNFISELSAAVPDVLIVSGLAYGIDINAHRAALKYNQPTIGVLAHGLDRIYPYAHRQTAKEMLLAGGLLTEFRSGTEPDRFNFVRRNRIVAGMADAVIVVESANKGGSLITAEIANSYCIDVFAVPGKMTDAHSSGCNKLIANHKADLLLSTQYFLEQMNWDEASQKKKKVPRQQQLFMDLSSEEQKIVNTLQNYPEGIHIDLLAREAEIQVYQMFSILLEMEMKNLIKNLPGNMYSLS
ncbi:DNA-processing protein DprA [Dysgonomonas sp. 25]|uniref:DNA-processing protein DprA n=1 Tax=Dysgonomonas sp. 25 TaxID=2302933 RepID=UPI0013D4726B|nr:DNA-processing protein DprA [Dysgonomonas sp. 25]NDV67825.1 DNA-protecting protein DprA [Dysgonomonas sp. 25]